MWKRYCVKSRFLRFASLICVFLFLNLFAYSQERPKLIDAVQILFDAAPLAPPEIAADMLIQIADSGSVPERMLKKELLERALQFSGL